jgi:hypothetical protein
MFDHVILQKTIFEKSPPRFKTGSRVNVQKVKSRSEVDVRIIKKTAVFCKNMVLSDREYD